MSLFRSISTAVVCLSVWTNIFALEGIDILRLLEHEEYDPFNDPTLIVVNCEQPKKQTIIIKLEEIDCHSKEVKLSSSCSSCPSVVDKLNEFCNSCRQPEAGELINKIQSLNPDADFFLSPPSGFQISAIYCLELTNNATHVQL